MLNLAKKIEKATRNYFLTHDEEEEQTWNDREKIWNRIQELTDEKGFHEARKQAKEEFIHATLLANCILKESHESLDEKKPKIFSIPIPDIFADEDELEHPDVEEKIEEIEEIEKTEKPPKDRKKHSVLMDLEEEKLD